MSRRTTPTPAWRRREVLKIGSLAFAGLNLPELLAATAGSSGSGKSCIVFFQNGGASQFETYDPKPEATSDVRGPFKDIPTAVPGVHFCELIPRSAKLLSKFAVIRSMTSDEGIHDRARQYIFSGTKPRNELLHPPYGSVVAKEWGPKNGLPPYVAIPNSDVCAEAGFLGPTYDPFITGDPSAEKFSVKDLTLPEGITLEEAASRARLLSALDAQFDKIAESPLVQSMDEFYKKAFELISSPLAKKAFDIAQEPDKVRDAYGRTTVGQSALLARRLIESGVRLATIFQGGYDTHVRNAAGHERILPPFDQAFSTLLEDLEERGLLETTLVLVIGDFGRTPKINSDAGRDHWPRVFSVALAGAGIQGGKVIGASDKNGSDPADRPVTVEDLGATVYKALGIDRHKHYHTTGRPVAINKDGNPVEELWS